MGQPVFTTPQITQWVRTEFVNTYNTATASLKEALAPVMEMDIPSTRLTEFYAYYLKSPHMKIWRRNETISEKGFNSVSFSVENKDWAIRIPWHENDERFDQTKSLVDVARKTGTDAAILDQRVFFQINTGATDNELLAAIPTAPDGAALYATTAGGVNRFEASSGNLLTGSGVATPAAIRNDFFSALEQFRLFKDGEGQPLLNPAELGSTYYVYYGAARMREYAEAFQQTLTSFTTVAAGNVAVSNVIADAGVNFKLIATPYITDDDAFVFCTGVPIKAIFSQLAFPLREVSADMANSDSVRTTKYKYMQWDLTKGFGISLPYQAIKINN